MKLCYKCKANKSEEDFNRNRKKKDGLQDICRTCDNARNREWYQQNTVRAKDRANRNNARYKKRGREFVIDYLTSHPCVDCGESDIVVLDFDHLGAKSFNVSDLIQRAGSLDRIQEEICKCEVVCANCHRRRTAKRGNFYRVAV